MASDAARAVDGREIVATARRGVVCKAEREGPGACFSARGDKRAGLK
jgi:hypothetical protein